MENNISSQINISMPNLINICVNEKEHGEIKGELYHCYAKDSVLFGNVIELLTIAEKLYDTICFPQASTKTRTFLESELQVQTARTEKVAASMIGLAVVLHLMASLLDRGKKNEKY